MNKNTDFKEIDFSGVSARNIFIDIDGTLVSDGAQDVPEEIIKKISSIAVHNRVFFCSNGSPVVAEKLAFIVGCEYIRCKKPFTGPFKKVLEKNNYSKVLVVGDKYITDGLLAKFLGADFLKTRRITKNSESIFVKFTYFLDDTIFKAISFIELIRPWQWAKNLLVFAPIFFALKAFDFKIFSSVTLAFVAFCLASSFAYIFNDLRDVEQDKVHILKRNRPIALGSISQGDAIFFGFLILLINILVIYFVPKILPIILIYLILNFVYSIKLKHFAIFDIFVISIFYILRVVAGGLAAGVPISPWIITCVFFGSLFVIVGKRKSENIQEKRRIVLEQYSEKALDLMLGVAASLAIVSYLMWSITDHVNLLTYSTIFVVFALLRILNTIYTQPEKTESPELLVFKDVSILTSFIMWLVYVFVIFYLI